MITKPQLLAAAALTAATANKPITRALAAAVKENLSAGEPRWWQAAAAGWKGRYFRSPDAALLLVLAAMHHEALSGHELAAELAAMLPSCGGEPKPDLTRVAYEFLQAPSPNFLMTVAHRRVRQFTVFDAYQWTVFAQPMFQRRALPYHVVELGTVAGLGACVDLFDSAPGFDASLIEARVGLDDSVLDVRQDADVQWAVACYLPDDLAMIAAAARTAGRLREALNEDAALVQVAGCATLEGPAFVEKNVPLDAEVGLLLFSSGMRQELAPEDMRTWTLSMHALLKGWGDRGLWVQFENDPQAGTAEIVLHRHRGNSVASVRAQAMRIVPGSALDVQNDVPGVAAFFSEIVPAK